MLSFPLSFPPAPSPGLFLCHSRARCANADWRSPGGEQGFGERLQAHGGVAVRDLLSDHELGLPGVMSEI